MQPDNKFRARHQDARLTEPLSQLTRAQRHLFVADCADHVLPLFQWAYPDDMRPAQAIEVRRRLARGEVSAREWRVAQYTVGDIELDEDEREGSIAGCVITHDDAATAADIAVYAVYESTSGADEAARRRAATEEKTWQMARLLRYLSGDQPEPRK